MVGVLDLGPGLRTRTVFEFELDRYRLQCQYGTSWCECRENVLGVINVNNGVGKSARMRGIIGKSKASSQAGSVEVLVHSEGNVICNSSAATTPLVVQTQNWLFST